MAVLRDYYNTGEDSQMQFGFVSGSLNIRMAQTFQASVSYDINSVKLKLYRSGSPGTITVELQGVSGENPDANVLATGTTDGDTLTTNTAGEWREITFAAPYSVVSGTNYAIVVSAQTYNTFWKKDAGGSYVNGAMRGVSVGENWGPVVPLSDAIFETYDNLTVPGKPTNPSPSDAVSDITLDESPLSWDASSPAADTYEIYFREQGGSWDLIGVAQAGVSYVLNFGYIDYSKTYEWRIDATNEAGTTTGDTWTFDSIVFDTIIPGGSGGSGGGGGGGGSGEESSPSGENNMITLRRLVAVTNNKIWFEDV